jgi:hypothetical protein
MVKFRVLFEVRTEFLDRLGRVRTRNLWSSGFYTFKALSLNFCVIRDAKSQISNKDTGVGQISRACAYHSAPVPSDPCDNAMCDVNKIRPLSAISTMMVLRIRYVIASLHV